MSMFESKPPIPTYPPIPQLPGEGGRKRTKPIKKRYEEWTDEEKEAYHQYIHDVRSFVGRLGGYPASRRVPKQPRKPSSAIFVSREDHAVLRAIARFSRRSITGLFHDIVVSLRHNPRYAHLFDDDHVPAGPQTNNADKQ